MPSSAGGRALSAWLLPGLIVCAATAAAQQSLRDPFEFGPRVAAGDSRGPVLIGVLWDATRPLAIVGDQTVGLGDRVGTWTIVDIQADRIVVEYVGRRETVRTGQRLPP